MSLNNIPIGTRLYAGFAAVLALTALIVGFAHLRLQGLEAGRLAQEAIGRQVSLCIQWRGEVQVNLARAVALTKAGNPKALRSHFAPLIREASENAIKLQMQLQTTGLQPAEVELVKKIVAARVAFNEQRDSMLKAMEGGESAGVALVDRELLPLAKVYMEGITTLLGGFEATARESAEAASRQARVTSTLLFAVGGVALLLGCVAAWSLTRSVARPMKELIAVAERIAQGNLEVVATVDRKDELGSLQQAIDDMRGGLGSLVAEIRHSTHNISTASAEIATGNVDLSSRTEQTASHLQQAASSMEQLTGNVKHSAESAHQANQLAASAAEVAARGGSVVAQVVSTMNEINASSKKIADIIGVIDGIAFQTNILALNAAVEAARAGEQGRGFAVVASEVRSLAGRSADAAKEIKTLIGASVDKVEVGSRLVADAGATMTEIVGSVQRVTDIIGEITTASNEQSDGIGQVNTAVVQLDKMTSQNAALVEQSAAAAESLKEQAGHLLKMVNSFKLPTESRADGLALA